VPTRHSASPSLPGMLPFPTLMIARRKAFVSVAGDASETLLLRQLYSDQTSSRQID
jgi:hypothetical protein